MVTIKAYNFLIPVSDDFFHGASAGSYGNGPCTGGSSSAILNAKVCLYIQYVFGSHARYYINSNRTSLLLDYSCYYHHCRPHFDDIVSVQFPNHRFVLSNCHARQGFPLVRW